MTIYDKTDVESATISFEFFPPQSTEASLRLWRSVERLAPLAPKFVSVTYGAGGTTRDRTKAAIKAIQERARLPVVGHLTCVGASREETLGVAREYAAMGVRRIVALRGDPPKGETDFVQHPEGFADAAELVEALSAEGIQSTVAAYPETHPMAASAESDLDSLKRKIDAGASEAITQFCFRTEEFLKFRDRVADAGITVPVHPGILPIENFERMARFAGACGTVVPNWLSDAFGNAKTEEDRVLLATAIATEQCDRLQREGANHLHFYTLNQPDLTYNIARALGYAPLPFAQSAQNGAA